MIKHASIIPLIGGMTLGSMKSAGNKPEFIVSWADFYNNDKFIVDYLKDVPYHTLPNESTTETLRNQYKGKIDFVNATCPCAGLSQLNASSNSRLSAGSDAIQNDWMYKSAEWVLENISPKVFWGENAPGLFAGMGEGVVHKLRKIAEKYKYSFTLYKTNTILHGIPQKRRRTFYFFWKSPTAPMMNWINRDKPTLIEYLKTIPKDASLQDLYLVEGNADDYFTPYKFLLEKTGLTHVQFRERTKSATVWRYLHDNNLIDECIEWLRKNYPTSGFSQKEGYKTYIDVLEYQMNKLKKNLGFWDSSPRFVTNVIPAVITRNITSMLHPNENRYFNFRELLHLMGFPHDFEVNGRRDWGIIGQNVPVNTSADLANEVIKFINNELPITDFKFIKQDNINKKIPYTETINKKTYTINSII